MFREEVSEASTPGPAHLDDGKVLALDQNAVGLVLKGQKNVGLTRPAKPLGETRDGCVARGDLPRGSSEASNGQALIAGIDSEDQCKVSRTRPRRAQGVGLDSSGLEHGVGEDAAGWQLQCAQVLLEVGQFHRVVITARVVSSGRMILAMRCCETQYLKSSSD